MISETLAFYPIQASILFALKMAMLQIFADHPSSLKTNRERERPYSGFQEFDTLSQVQTEKKKGVCEMKEDEEDLGLRSEGIKSQFYTSTANMDSANNAGKREGEIRDLMSELRKAFKVAEQEQRKTRQLLERLESLVMLPLPLCVSAHAAEKNASNGLCENGSAAVGNESWKKWLGRGEKEGGEDSGQRYSLSPLSRPGHIPAYYREGGKRGTGTSEPGHAKIPFSPSPSVTRWMSGDVPQDGLHEHVKKGAAVGAMLTNPLEGVVRAQAKGERLKNGPNPNTRGSQEPVVPPLDLQQMRGSEDLQHGASGPMILSERDDDSSAWLDSKENQKRDHQKAFTDAVYLGGHEMCQWKIGQG